MHGLASIVGQERAVARLRAALARGMVHHAYLFEGPDGVGKRSAALALAQAWHCEQHPGEGCGACPPCRKVAGDVHPDVVRLQVFNEEGKVKDQSERVRDLIAAVGFPPHEGRARIVIVDPAHELNATASNILLKTLEEPPRATHFVLITTAAARLLPTIRSRCQRVAFVPLGDALVAQRLEASGIEPGDAAAAAAMAGGSLARAFEIAGSEELPQRRERVARWRAAARAGQARGIIEAAGEMAGDREEALASLELLWVAYHAALVRRIEGGDRAAHDGGTRTAPSGTVHALHAIEEATDAVRGNVGPQLAVERLLLRLHHLRAR